MIEAMQFEFMRNALAAGLLASIICGIMGTLVVVNRIVFLSGGIAHAAYGGIGLAFYFNWPYLPATIGFSLFAAMVMATISHTVKHRADTIIGDDGQIVGTFVRGLPVSNSQFVGTALQLHGHLRDLQRRNAALSLRQERATRAVVVCARTAARSRAGR